MDTVHDLGGRQGFGPVHWQDDNDSRLFHEEWQARTWAMCRMMFSRYRSEPTGWTLDWYRHVIERVGPSEYLRLNYFDKWVQSLMATLIDDGVADLEEFIASHARRELSPVVARPLTASREPAPPRFIVGDNVLTIRDVPSMHTRLPGYARGRRGIIERSIGPEIFPDASAKGDIREEPLYVVRFSSSELWPDQDAGRYAVRLDLWDSYLESV